MMSIKYFRRDGSPYPDGDEGLYELGKDFEDVNKKRVALTYLDNGVYISTVWVGLAHGFRENDNKPFIFETMVFDPEEKTQEAILNMPSFKYHEELYQERYTTEEEALAGHEKAIKMFEDWKEGDNVDE